MHLSEDEVARLLVGDVATLERSAWDRHVDGCAECRRLLAEMVHRSIQSAQPPGKQSAQRAERAERAETGGPALPDRDPLDPLIDATIELGLSATLPSVRVARPHEPLGDDTTQPMASGPRSRYLELELIGRGGMGEVLAVRDLALDRLVALKRVRPENRDPLRADRFVQEARLLASLEHPSIIPIHDAGRLDDGDAFFTMKMARGNTLADLIVGLKRGDPELTKIWTPIRLYIAFLHVVEAIAYAHARGVLHCDLKPANVLVGEHREILVADWGLARRKDDAAVVPVDGTPLYLAPERLTGRPPDERSDIYSLGAILYELLTLEPPVSAASYPDLLVGLFAREIVPPKERRPDLEIPDELDQLAMRALARRPEDRPERAEMLRSALEQVLAGERRRQTAIERLAAAEEADAEWSQLTALDEELERRRQQIARGVKSWDGESKKRPLWNLEEQLFDVRLRRDEALSRALDGYGQTIAIDPRIVAAEDRFADLHLMLFLEAEHGGDRRAQLLHRRQVELHHRGRHRAVLSGAGTLAITPQHGGALIGGVRLIERGKKIVAGDPLPPSLIVDGRLPETKLSQGSWVFDITAPGAAPCLVHVLLSAVSRCT